MKPAIRTLLMGTATVISRKAFWAAVVALAVSAAGAVLSPEQQAGLIDAGQVLGNLLVTILN